MNKWALKLVTDGADPVTLAEARTFSRIDSDQTAEDTLITALVTAARKEAEAYCLRSFVSATWRLTLDYFPSWEIRLPRPPLISVASVVYTATDETSTTISSSDYSVLTDHEPGILVPAYGEEWPEVLDQDGSVRITYSAGYGNAASVPEGIKTAIKWLVTYWVVNRLPTTEIPGAFYAMLTPYKHAYEFGVDEYEC